MENCTFPYPPNRRHIFVATYNYLNRMSIYDAELAHMSRRIHGWKYDYATKRYNNLQTTPDWLRRRIIEVRYMNHFKLAELLQQQTKKHFETLW